MLNLKNTNELIYETGTDSQKSNLRLPKGKGQGEGISWEFRIDIYTHYYT